MTAMDISQPEREMTYNVMRYLVLADDASAIRVDAGRAADRPRNIQRVGNINFRDILKLLLVNKHT
jgi:hypothetical protein